MKRTDLVQLAIIIVGIFISYAFISAIPSLLFTIYNWFDSGLRGGMYMDSFLATFLLYAFYFFAGFLSITKSQPLAVWLCNKANFNGDINLLLDKNDLLFALFTGLGIYGIIQHLPQLLVNGFIKIRSNNNFTIEDSQSRVSNSFLVTELLTLLLFFTLLYYAQVFADYLSKKINNPEPVDEIAENKTTD
jgi:hypothetical protein